MAVPYCSSVTFDKDSIMVRTIFVGKESKTDFYHDMIAERRFENHVEEMKRDGKTDAEIASGLVEMWMEEHYYLILNRDQEGENGFNRPEDGLGEESEPYLDTSYWAKQFVVETASNYSEAFWNELFTCNEGEFAYHNKDSLISNLIPDDPIHRFVLHFLRGWKSRLHKYILDEQICEEERVLVLKKQVENFAFFSRKKPFGGLWKMYSEPDDLLRQALNAAGMPVAVHDAQGNPLRGIQGEPFFYKVVTDIPKVAADGPSPDVHDRKIYDYIRRFAVRKLGQDQVHNSWTMVKSSFHYNSKNTRCYAFSGHGQSKKELHKMPLAWWETSGGDDAWEDDQKIRLGNVDHSQFGQHLVSALFNALRPFIEEDFEKLARHVAFDEKSYAESVIEGSRKDIGVLDYGEFYDCVVTCFNRFFDMTEKAITGVLNSVADTSTVVESVMPFVTVGANNKEFAPDKDKIKQCLESYGNIEKVDEICDKLCRISEKHLQRLEKELKEVPNKFITVFAEHLQQSKCGEDNVIGLVLRELLLSNCECLLSVKVQFVALDADSKDNGKPFCGVCASKVRFYSVLPQLLRAIGSTGEDFDQLAPLFAKLRLRDQAAAGNPS
ncbi:uncharacterized protein LOC144666694 [Oculina patagonica]